MVLNNATDIIASVAVLIGLRLAQNRLMKSIQVWTLESRECSKFDYVIDHACCRAASTLYSSVWS